VDPTRRGTAAPALNETEKELRLASDNFLTRIERLHALEEQKRELPVSEMADMAHEVEALTREILEWAGRQTDLADEVAALDDGDARPIAIVPPRSLGVILEEWRAAERSLQGEEPGTAAYESGRADVDRLRDEYARAYKAQSSHRG
jgi:ActR/RegA family two-component response regulator